MKTATPFAWVLTVALCAQSVSAATRTVSNLNDSGPGSLRELILLSIPGDTIDFFGGGTIVLSSELVIGRSLTIVGPAGGVTVSGNNRSRVFNIISGTVILSNLVVSNGRMVGTNALAGEDRAGGSAQGGGLLNSGNLSLINCTLHANEVVGGQGGAGIYLGGDGGSASGGAICNFGSLTLLNCTLDSNSIRGGVGGDSLGIGGSGGKGGNAYGGAIHTTGMVSLVNCTLSRGSASGGNGGFGDVFGGAGGNAAGGGLFLGGTATLHNTILSGSASAGPGGLSFFSPGPNGSVIGPDVYGAVSSQGHNLVGQADGSSGWVANDLTGTVAAPLDPQLDRLQDNGGPTLTLALLPLSAALDAGDDSVTSTLATDQRGRPRASGAHVDIGSYEVNPSPVAMNLNDSGAGSLRNAIFFAAPGDSITFAASVAGTIVLTSGELAFGKSLTIVGPTAAGVTVSGNQASRVFHIYGGVVSLANLTIANGNTASYGAGFFVAPGASLILNNCTVSGNTSADSGGGIANNGSVLVTNCTFSGNRALQGGGIYTHGGPVLLRSCTVCSNIATTAGGGLYDYGIAGSVFTVGSTVVARNTAAAAPDVISNPAIPFISLGYNLIGNGSSGYGFANGVDRDQVGSLATPLNPLLGPLQDNGGPTFSHALLSGSPAIDLGNSDGSGADQRGRLRPFDFGSVANASGGDGSDIGAFELQPAPLFLMGPVKSGNDIVVSFSSDLGQRYRIERKDALAPGGWTTVADNLSGTGGIVPVTDPGGAEQPQRFYRGQVLP